MAIDTADLKRAWTKKGFQKTARADEHEVCFPNTLVKTHCSNGPREDLGPKLQKMIAVQMHLTKQELLDYVQCRYSLDQYRKHLTSLGYISEDSK